MGRLRRNVVHEQRAAYVATAAGLVASLFAPDLTSYWVASAVIFAVAVAGVTWVAASAPWWAVSVVAAVAAAMAGNPVAIAAGVVAAGIGLWIGSRRRDLPEARAVTAGIALNVLAHSELNLFLGASAIVGVAVAMGLAVTGILRRPRRIRRRAYAVAGGVAGLAVLAGVGFGIAVASAQSNLTTGKRHAEQAITALNHGDFDTAAAEFRASERAMRRADSQLGKPWAAPASLLPVVSQHRHVVTELAGTGVEASATVAAALEQIDPDSVRVNDGVIDLAAVGRLEAPFVDVDAALADLSAAVDDARSPWLVDPVIEALDELDAEIAENAPRLDNAISAVQLAPDLLGGNGTRRYLILFTTPAEARGLGGFTGNYAELTVDNGQIEMSEFGRASDLERIALDNAARITGPEPFLVGYGRFGYDHDGVGRVGNASWRNLTISPNFPDVAEVAAELYPQSGGQPIDGVIAMDPFVIQALLAYTGPIELTTVDKTLNTNNAADYLLTGQYLEPDRDDRVDALEEAAELTVDALLTGSLPDPTELARDLGPLAAERRLLVWTDDAAEQDLLDRVGLLGDIPAHDGADGYSVAVTNAGGSKIDTFLERAITYDSTTDPETGETTAVLRVELTNTAPSTGLPDYVIGNALGLPSGTSRLFVEFYSPLALEEVTLNGELNALEPGEIMGWNTYSTFVNIAPGATVTYELQLQGRLDRPDELVTWEQPLVIPVEVNEDN